MKTLLSWLALPFALLAILWVAWADAHDRAKIPPDEREGEDT